MSFQDFLVQQNAHWTGEHYETGVKRECFEKVIEYLQFDQIIALTGVRRSGKSTLMKQIINYLLLDKGIDGRNIVFLNLEHPILSAYTENPLVLQTIYETYLKLTNPTGLIYMFLDEVQFLRQWPVFVKSLYETKKVKFVITGSNASMLSSDLLTLLSGRAVEVEIYPFSFREAVTSININWANTIDVIHNRPKLLSLLDAMLLYGSLPLIVTNANKSPAYDILGSHAKMVLLQDVAPRLGIRKPLDLEKLYVYIVSNISRVFSYNNLSNLVGLSDKSIKDYICALIESYMIFELEEFSFSLKKQIRSLKKFYAIDTGQAKAMGFEFSPNKGRFLENFLFLEFKRLKLEIFYYKTEKDLEIDFVLKHHHDLVIVQVAWEISSFQTYDREMKAIDEAKKELNIKKSFLIVFEKPLEDKEDQRETKIISALDFLLKHPREQLLLLFNQQELSY